MRDKVDLHHLLLIGCGRDCKEVINRDIADDDACFYEENIRITQIIGNSFIAPNLKSTQKIKFCI